MRLTSFAVGALMMGSAAAALAQDTSDQSAENLDVFAATVKQLAQDENREGGIGNQVSELARARSEDGDEDADTDDLTETEDAEGSGIGAAVSAAAQTAARAEDREPGSVADAVLDQTPAAAGARNAVARTSVAPADGRSRAEEARLAASPAAATARDNAASARNSAGSARDSANAARDVAAAARDNARSIPRPGRPGG